MEYTKDDLRKVFHITKLVQRWNIMSKSKND